MFAAFQEVVRQRQGIAEAEVSSAVELNDAQKAEFASRSSADRQTRRSEVFTGPGLLGGAVVRIGDTIYDGSLRNRLNEMRARLAAE